MLRKIFGKSGAAPAHYARPGEVGGSDEEEESPEKVWPMIGI